MAKILYLHPGYVPPPEDERRSLFFHISANHEGDVIQPVWGRRGSYESKSIGRFSFHFTYSHRWTKPFRQVWEILFYVLKGWYLYRSRNGGYDVVMCYGWNKTGLAAVMLKWITGAKLIVEVPGTPGAGQRFQSARTSWLIRWRSKSDSRLLKFVLARADAAKLLSPRQIGGDFSKHRLNTAVFHNLVPVSLLAASDTDEGYILLMGHPWYLKGVDVLVKAFQRISDEFPHSRLRIVGHCPDRSYFETLRAGDERIEFLAAVKHHEAMRQMAGCSAFVLASRTEAMGRVLLEAMALRKPIVASCVDGIPHYIHHNENGLLFASENVEDLAAKLRQILGNEQLAQRLADTGYRVVHEKYSEKAFAEAFDELMRGVLSCP